MHAHPDDEAIFTGGTISLLIGSGHHVSLVVATGGELGIGTGGSAAIAEQRRSETLASCAALGLNDPNDVTFLDYQDSGLHGENAAGLASQDPLEAAAAIASLDKLEGPVDAVVGYDANGIYGHPDHVAVYRITQALAGLLETRSGTRPTIYESTVDREYLHFVETHVVVDAQGGRPVGRGLSATDLGSATLDIDVSIDVSPVLEPKRAALAAHSSQLPADAPMFELGQANFAAVYGWEWYRRVGPVGVLDEL